MNSKLMFKMYNGIAPESLCNLLPPLVHERTAYNLRSGENMSFEKKNRSFSTSFIPLGIEIRNSLSQLIRSVNTVEIFKSKLKENSFSVPKIPRRFIQGTRVESIYHCRIKNGCSNLNKDLYDNHLKDSPACDCGTDVRMMSIIFLDVIYNTI